MKKHTSPLGGALSCALSYAVLGIATANAQSTPDEIQYIETMVVTANRDQQPITDVQASVQVFNRADIDAFSGSSLTEVLRQAVGVDARSSGANSVVSIRGQIPNAGTSVLLLVDGMPRTGKFGQLDLNTFPVEDVASIEVIRGPLSSLYGANAAGGVINIITKTPGEGSPLSLSILGGGTDSSNGSGRSTYRVGGSASKRIGQTGHTVALDYRDADPYRFDDSLGGDDLFGIDHLSLTYRGSFVQSDTSEFTWTLERYEQDDRGASVTRGGDEFERYEKEERQYGSLRWEGEVGPGRLVLEGSYGHSDAAVNRSFPAPDEETDFTQQFYQGLYYTDFDEHALLFGMGKQVDEIDISILTKVRDEKNTFAYLQDQWSIRDNLRAVLGIRFDQFDSFGNRFTPRLTIGTRNDGLTWRLGYGEAFRAPDVIEQFARFSRGRFLIVGAPDIEAEITDTYEAALGWRRKSGFVELVYHNSNIDNLIQAELNGEQQDGLLIFEYQNVAEAQISGVELSGEYALGYGVTFTGAYEHLEARDSVNDERLQGRARDTVRLGLTYRSDSITGTIRSRHTLSFFGIDPSDRQRPAFESNYSVVDMSLRYQLDPQIAFTLGVDNILDRMVPDNWSSTGAIEDPAGRFVYLRFDFKMSD